MNKPIQMTSQNIEPFEDRIDILYKELEMALKWQQPSILFAISGSARIQTQAKDALEKRITVLGQKVHYLQINKEEYSEIPLLQLLSENADNTTVFFVEGIGEGVGKDVLKRLRELDIQLEYFVEDRIRIVFWLKENEVIDLAHNAPSYWSLRHRVVEFVEPAQSDRMLHKALESAWQEMGEFPEPLENTYEKISLRESLLIGLPKGNETTALRANLLLTLGILHWRKGNYEKSGEFLQTTLEIARLIEDKWFMAVCFNAIALVKTNLGKYLEAIEAYKQAINLAPDRKLHWNNLGNLYSMLGYYDEALASFDKAIEHNPEDAISWNGIGNVYQKIGRIDDALSSYQKAINLAPCYANPWDGMGNIYVRTNKIDKAIIAYQKAIKLDKHFISSWIHLGRIYMKQKQNENAIAAYQKAIGIDPKNAQVWNEMGNIYLDEGVYEDAINAYNKAIELNSGFGWSYSNLALAYVRIGKCADALPLFQKSIELLNSNRDKAITWNRLGNVYRRLNDYDNAALAYKNADELDSENASYKGDQVEFRNDIGSQNDTIDISEDFIGAKSQRAKVFQQKNPSDNKVPVEYPYIQDQIENVYVAEEENTHAGSLRYDDLSIVDASNQDKLNEIINVVDIKNAHIWNELGNIYFDDDVYEKAISAYSKAIELDQTYGLPYRNLALTYLQIGKYAEAIPLFRKSLELLSNNSEKAVSWNGLGKVYQRLNNNNIAVRAYRKAIELEPENASFKDDLRKIMIDLSLDEKTSATDRHDTLATNLNATELKLDNPFDSSSVGNKIHTGGDDSVESTQKENGHESVCNSYESDLGEIHNGIEPKNAQIWNDLGEIYFHAGAYEDAINAYSKAIELDRGFGLPYSNLGLTYSSKGKYAEAIPLYQRSIELLSNNRDKAQSWKRLGNAYRRLNDYDKAITAYQRANELDPNNVPLLTQARFSLLSNSYVG